MEEMNYTLVMKIIRDRYAYLKTSAEKLQKEGVARGYSDKEIDAWADLRALNAEAETLSYFFTKTKEINPEKPGVYVFPKELITPEKIMGEYELEKRLTATLNPQMGNARGRHRALEWLESLVFAIEEIEAKQRKRWEI